ncbi:hypothetical protein BDY21DRAFT_105879 [Lineolata rhizophorae]|uniref:Uncharacterized protein n=1 Tax=Lineolata rhizophorae TaxID=578093 RepID=A0A6A6NSP7_9PEZI|nr:hypothetical protein BDY21DRAFT_105879 [Lineolata rhizophorae]
MTRPTPPRPARGSKGPRPHARPRRGDEDRTELGYRPQPAVVANSTRVASRTIRAAAASTTLTLRARNRCAPGRSAREGPARKGACQAWSVPAAACKLASRSTIFAGVDSLSCALFLSASGCGTSLVVRSCIRKKKVDHPSAWVRSRASIPSKLRLGPAATRLQAFLAVTPLYVSTRSVVVTAKSHRQRKEKPDGLASCCKAT